MFHRMSKAETAFADKPNLLYMNFDVQTNQRHRQRVREAFLRMGYNFTRGVPLSKYFEDAIMSKFVVSPIGKA